MVCKYTYWCPIRNGSGWGICLRMWKTDLWKRSHLQFWITVLFI